MGRRIDPILVALVVGGVLAVIGISLAVIAPVVSGSPRADSLPAGVAMTASGGPAPSGAASAGPSTQANPDATTAHPSPTDRFRPDGLESQVVKLTNDARQQAHCKGLSNNSRLHTVARAHSTDMATTNTFSSTGSDGSSFADRATKAGYKDPLGENIARGQTTAQDVVQYWLTHPAMKARMLDCTATNIGVGAARAADGTYFWTQDFGK